VPVKYRFDANIVVIELIGEYTLNDIRTTILNSLADSAHIPNSFLLIDFSKSKSIDRRSSEEIHLMADFLASLGTRFSNRIALVGPDDLKFGLLRMGSAGSEDRGINSNVSRTFEDARKWLLS
jgi:hypothetical protein